MVRPFDFADVAQGVVWALPTRIQDVVVGDARPTVTALTHISWQKALPSFGSTSRVGSAVRTTPDSARSAQRTLRLLGAGAKTGRLRRSRVGGILGAGRTAGTRKRGCPPGAGRCRLVVGQHSVRARRRLPAGHSDVDVEGERKRRGRRLRLAVKVRAEWRMARRSVGAGQIRGDGVSRLRFGL